MPRAGPGGSRHVSSRITEDDRLLDHVAAGTESEDAAIRLASGEIREVLLLAASGCISRLEDRLVRSHRTFLDAQTEQRLARRVRLRLLSLQDQLFSPSCACRRHAAMSPTSSPRQRSAPRAPRCRGWAA